MLLAFTLCNFRNILSSFIPTVSPELEDQSLYKGKIEVWTDIVVYTQHMGQNLEGFIIYDERVMVSSALQESLRPGLAPGGCWIHQAALCTGCGAEWPQPAGTFPTAALCNSRPRAEGQERFLQMR